MEAAIAIEHEVPKSRGDPADEYLDPRRDEEHAAVLSKLAKHDSQFEATQKILYRLLEGRSS